jgi:gluconokinase
LGKLRQLIVDSLERREHLVLACSALTRAHREALAGGLRRVRFLYLKTNRAVLKDRLASRPGHFAGPALLDSQLATIEEPLPDEALVVDATADIDTIVGHVRLEFGL